VELTDVLNYPIRTPVINRISGCSDVDNSTVDCPTKGNVTLTLYGVNFNSPLTILISSRVCVLLTLANTTDMLTCLLPVGAGFLQSVSMVCANDRITQKCQPFDDSNSIGVSH
jgi:hypothetical protein